MADIHIHVSYTRGKATVSGETVPGVRWIKRNVECIELPVVVDSDGVNELALMIEQEGLSVEVR